MPVATEKVEERWGALWDASPQRSPFSRLDYLRAVSAAAGQELSIHVVEDEGSIAAGAALTWKRRGPYRMALLPPFTPFSALLLRDRTLGTEVHSRSSSFGRLLRELETSYDAVHLRLHPTIRDVRPATWGDWKVHPFYTYVVSFERDGDAMKGWSSSTARNYRTARDSFEIIEGTEAAAAAIELCQASYARHGRSAPLSETALKKLVTETSTLHESFAVRRRSKGRPIDAAVVILNAAGRAYYWIAGSRPGNAMTVLIGELFARFDPERVREFDFVGANTPTIAEFKRKFGSTLESYYGLRYYRRKDLQLLEVIREQFRR